MEFCCDRAGSRCRGLGEPENQESIFRGPGALDHAVRITEFDRARRLETRLQSKHIGKPKKQSNKNIVNGDMDKRSESELVGKHNKDAEIARKYQNLENDSSRNMRAGDEESSFGPRRQNAKKCQINAITRRGMLRNRTYPDIRVSNRRAC